MFEAGAFDLKLYGQCYLNVIWSQDRTTISEVYHVPCANVRCGKVNDNDEVTQFYYSTDWEHVSQNPPQVIPAFSANDRTAASQMLQIKLYNPQSFYYGLPDYIGSLSWIDADAKVADFHSSSLENGLFPSMVINFRSGVPSDEERQKLERLIYDKFEAQATRVSSSLPTQTVQTRHRRLRHSNQATHKRPTLSIQNRSLHKCCQATA